jgi:hypothetical protein
MKLMPALTLLCFCAGAESQGQTVNIAAVTSPILVCQTATFTVSITGSVTAFQVQVANGVSYESNTASISVDHTTQLWEFTSGSNMPSTFNYTVHVDCSTIDGVTQGGTGLSVVDHIISINGVSATGTIPYIVDFPLLVYQPALSTGSMGVLLDWSSTICTYTRDFVYRNNGSDDGDFIGTFTFSDDFCEHPIANGGIAPDLEICFLDVWVGNTQVQSNVAPTIIGTSAISATFSLTAPNGVPQNGLLRIVEHFRPLVCIAPQCNSDIDLAWGCSGQPPDLCQTESSQATVVRAPERPQLYLTTTSPSGGDANHEDLSCPGADTPWSYTIENNGSAPALEVAIALSMGLPASDLPDFTYLFEPQLTWDDGTPVPVYEEDPLFPVDGADMHHTNCYDNWPFVAQPINYVHFVVDRLEPGRHVTLTFNTFRCCASDLTINGVSSFNQPKDFNHWVLTLCGDDDCGMPGNLFAYCSAPVVETPIPPTFTDPTPVGYGYISHNGDFAEHDLNWTQSFVPDPIHLHGPYLDDPSTPECDLEAGAEYHIENLNFMPAWIDEDIFSGAVYDNDFRVDIRVDWILDQGLSLAPDSIRWEHTLGGPAYVLPTSFDPPVLDPLVVGQQSCIFSFTPNAMMPTIGALRNFILGSYISFYLAPCCPAREPFSILDVRMYIDQAPDGCPQHECWVPMTQNIAKIYVHCPGCLAPGMIVDVATLDRTTLGLVDSNDNGFPDSQQVIDDTYLHYPQVRLDRSIAGDELIATVGGYCTDGSSFTWADHVAPMEFDNLYLEFEIPYAQTLASNLSIEEVTFTFSDPAAGNTWSLLITGSDIPSIVTKIDETDRARFFYQFELNDPASPFATLIQNAGMPPKHFPDASNNNNIRYTVETKFHVCGNFAPDDPLVTPVDSWQHRSEFNAFMYRTDVDLTAPAFGQPGHPTLSDFLSGSGADQMITGNELMFCEAWGGVHNFLAVDNISFANASNGTACGATMDICEVVRIGGNQTFNLFPYEFREAPSVYESLNIAVPPYFGVVEAREKSVVYYRANSPNPGSYAPYHYTAASAVYPPPPCAVPSPACSYTHTVDPSHFDFNESINGLTSASPNGQFSYPLPMGDEYSEIHYLLTLTTDCGLTHSVAIDYPAFQATFADHGCAGDPELLGPIGMMIFALAPPILDIQEPNYTVSAATHEICWTVPVHNVGWNAQLILALDPAAPWLGFSNGLTWSANGSVPAPIPDDGIVLLPNGLPHPYFDVTICGHYTCGSGPQPDLHLEVGWTCQVDDPADFCELDATDLLFDLEPADLNETQPPAAVPTDYPLCTPFDLTYCFNSPFLGSVYGLQCSISLPAGLALNTNDASVELSYDNGQGTVTTCDGTIPGTGGTTWLFSDLIPQNPPWIAPCPFYDEVALDGLENGEAVCVTISVIADCDYDGTFPTYAVHGVDYCDQDVDLTNTTIDPLAASGVDACVPSCNCGGIVALFEPIYKTDCSGIDFMYQVIDCSLLGFDTEYLWDFGDGSPVVVDQQTAVPMYHFYGSYGTFTVTLTMHCLDNGAVMCEEVYSMDVTTFAPSTLTVTGTDPSCYWGNDGTAEVDPSPLVPPFSILWNTGANTLLIDDLTAGTYSVEVMQGACIGQGTITLNDPPPITVTITVTPPSSSGTCDATATANVSGAQGAITYAWDNGATTQTISGLCPNTWVTVYAEDANLCKTNATVFIPDVCLGACIQDCDHLYDLDRATASINIVPVPEADHYRMEFSTPCGYERIVTTEPGANGTTLNWDAPDPLEDCQTYQVRAQAYGADNHELGPWGPYCRFTLTNCADPLQLEPHYCGASDVSLNGTVAGNKRDDAYRYQFEFRPPAGEPSYISPVPQGGPGYTYMCNRASLADAMPALRTCTTYRVRVRRSFDCTENWDDWGPTCLMRTIGCFGAVGPDVLPDDGGAGAGDPGGGGGGGGRSATTGDPLGIGATLTIFPNPNDGSRLNVVVSYVEPTVRSAEFSMLDILGRTVLRRAIMISGTSIVTEVDLGQRLSAGVYSVQIDLGSTTLTSSLVIH